MSDPKTKFFLNKYFVLLAIFLCFGAVFIFNATQKAKGQNSKGLARNTTSTISTDIGKDGQITVTSANRRFTFSNYLTENVLVPEQARTLLLLEEFKSEKKLTAEDQKSTVTVEAWMGKDANPTDKIWTITEVGDEGLRTDRFYQVTKYGCCAAEPTYNYFNLLSGQKAFTSNIPLISIIVPNTSIQFTRYVAYHSIFGSIIPAERDKIKDMVGVLEYGSENKMIGKLIVRTSLGDYVGTPKIKINYQDKIVESWPLMLWGADKKKDISSLSDFSLIISFDVLGDIVIPVNNDSFVINKATLPKKFFIE